MQIHRMQQTARAHIPVSITPLYTLRITKHLEHHTKKLPNVRHMNLHSKRIINRPTFTHNQLTETSTNTFFDTYLQTHNHFNKTKHYPSHIV